MARQPSPAVSEPLSLWQQFLEQGRKDSIAWAIRGLLALIAGGAFWLWGWFAAGGPQRAFGALPPGAVVAFAKEECPRELGWTPFKHGTGRFIVGAGDTYAPGFENWDRDLGDGKKQTIALKDTSLHVFDHGGEVTHQLTIDQLPAHDHKMQTERATVQPAPDLALDKFVGRDDPNTDPKRSHISYSEKEGAGKPFNVSGPYIALNLCQKE